MREQGGFEARGVIAPGRKRLGRITLLLPAITLIAIAWVGINGARPGGPTATAHASAAPLAIVQPGAPRPTEAPYPAQVIGLTVQRLDAVQTQNLGNDDVVAVAGWYVPLSLVACPSQPALFVPDTSPNSGGEVDPYAFCIRSGVFSSTDPVPDAPVVIDSLEGTGSRSAGPESVDAAILSGVVVPPQMEVVGGDPAEVVVLGRFVAPDSSCGATCSRLLVIDHVAWTPGS